MLVLPRCTLFFEYRVFVPIKPDPSLRVKRIVVGSFYISPNSQHKAATIEHIVETRNLLIDMTMK